MTIELIGKPVTRVDGRAKVTGAARYAADFNQRAQLHAVIVSATAGLGRVAAIDRDAAMAMPGVVEVITHSNAPKLAYAPHKSFIDPAAGERLHVLQDDRVRFYGQPVALVVADTLDSAERAANAMRVSYEVERPLIDPRDPKAQAIQPSGTGDHGSAARGDADRAVSDAPVKIDASYDMARENHNPMEPHAVVASWDDDTLTLWSKSQFVVNEQAEISAIFGLPVRNVRVICPFVGGAFGTSLRTWPHVTLAAMAAREVGRPVKLVLNRKQMFFTTGHRPRTLQRVAIGSARDGRITGIVHEGNGETSRYEEFTEALLSATSYMYSCPNLRTSYRLTPLDIGTPNHMRGPGEASGIFALECALDELSYALGMDPIELRRRNEPEIDEGENRPFSSRSLVRCYEVGSDRFGWHRRTSEPRSMRDGRLLVGMGVASATYPVFYGPASARARIHPDGTASVEVAASDMGPGTYTSMTQVAAETLGIPVEQVRVDIGRSDFPPAPPHGGSMTMASVGSAVHAACLAAMEQVARRAVGEESSPVAGAALDKVEWVGGKVRRLGDTSAGQSYRDILAPTGQPIEASASNDRDLEVGRRYSMHAFGAVFAEVAIDPDVGTIRVRRALGAYGAGRIVNPLLAASQCTGGMIGGIGMALMEQTALDSRDGRPVNAHMADYLMPVNLDIGQFDVEFIEEDDPYVNALGVKGLGEIALVGMAPAIANAIFHATGKRVRHLPIRIEDILGA